MKHQMRRYRNAAAVPTPSISNPPQPERLPNDLTIPEKAGEGRLKFPKFAVHPSKAHTINVAKRGYLFSPIRTFCKTEFVEINRTLLLELIRLAEEPQ